MDVKDKTVAICNHSHGNKSKPKCIPIGIIQAQFSLNAFKIPDEFKWFQMRSACLMAFCHLFIQDPLKWTSQTINTILINGAKIVGDNYLRVKEGEPLDCVLNIENYIAKILIERPIILNIVPTHTPLAETLQTFFNNHQFGLFRCFNLCYLIWKANEIYFLFDGQGSGNSPKDRNGFASLLCTESLKDVSKLLKTIGSIRTEDCYSISPIHMKLFRKGTSGSNKPRIHYTGTSTYTVINDGFAIVSGKFHIEHYGFKSLQKRQSLPVGLMALIFNEIQPSNSWNSQMIDKIILIGTKLFHECKKTLQGEVTIQHLPRTYPILEYKFKIDYKPFELTGQLTYELDDMKKNLLVYLRKAFGVARKAVLIQTNAMSFAIWECNDYYYIFDAYARNEGEEGLGACNLMHGNLESLCSVFCTNIDAIASDRNDGFELHGVNVTLERNNGGKVDDIDLELINAFMDELFLTEMSNFQESSARSSEICNLDDTSDIDIFLDTVEGLARPSIESASTTSYMSGTDTGSQTNSSQDSNSSIGQSNDDSLSQDSSSTLTGKSKEKHEEKNKRKNEQKNEQKNEEKNEEKSKEKSKEKNKEKNKEKKKEKNKKKNKEENEPEEPNKDPELVADSKKKNADKQSEKKEKKAKGKKDKKSKKGQNEEQKKQIVVVESSSGTESSIKKLLITSFQISDRVLLVTDWGEFFVAQENNIYILCDGCLCDYNAWIQVNLAELTDSIRSENIDSIVEKIMQSKDMKRVAMKLKSEDTSDVVQRSNRNDEEIDLCPHVGGDGPLWDLMEEIIVLMKTTAKFDEITSELI